MAIPSHVIQRYARTHGLDFYEAARELGKRNRGKRKKGAKAATKQWTPEQIRRARWDLHYD